MILSDTFDSSSSDAKYKAQYDTETGKGTCNCPGWIKRAVRECRHTKLLLACAAKVDHKAALDHATRTGDVDALVDTVYGSPAYAWINQKAGLKVAPADDLPVDPFQGFREPPAVKPMLASAMRTDQSLSDFINDEWVMEEKYDGHRLLLVVTKSVGGLGGPLGKTITGWSRPGHDRPSAERKLPQHIVDAASHLPSGIYDGELRIPGGTSSDVVRLDLQDKLVLVLFDAIEIMGASIVSTPLSERRSMLEVAVAHVPYKQGIWLARQEPVTLRVINAIWLEGGEGAILKRKASQYKSGWRTPDWVKVKKVEADQLTVIGFEEGKSGPQSIFKLKHKDGRETSVKILTNDLLRSVAKNPSSYIGRKVTISYMGLTTSGLWRHPIFDHFVN